MRELPFFPCYPKDLLADHKVIVMDNRTFGAYWRLLCIAWHENPPASLPNDDAVLAAYANETPAGWQEISAKIISCFTLRNGRYYQKRLQIEHEQATARHIGRSDGAKARWGNRRPIGRHKESNKQEDARESGCESGFNSESGNGDSELPSQEQFVAHCGSPICGITQAEAIDLYQKLSARGWKDGSGNLITNWRIYCTRMRKYIEQDRAKNAPKGGPSFAV